MRLEHVVIAVLLACAVAAHEPRRPKPEPKVEASADEIDSVLNPGWKPESGIAIANVKEVATPPKRDRHRKDHVSSWRYANEAVPEPPKIRKPRAEPRRVTANLFVRDTPKPIREPTRVTISPHIITRRPESKPEIQPDLIRAHVIRPEVDIPVPRHLVQASINQPEPIPHKKHEYVFAHAIITDSPPPKPSKREYVTAINVTPRDQSTSSSVRHKREYVTAVNVTPRDDQPTRSSARRKRDYVRAHAISSDQPITPALKRDLRVVANAHISSGDLPLAQSSKRDTRVVANAHIGDDTAARPSHSPSKRNRNRIVDVANAHITHDVDMSTPSKPQPKRHRIVAVADAHITHPMDGAQTPTPKRPPTHILADAERVLFPKGDSGLPHRRSDSQPSASASAAPKVMPVSADVKLERL